MHVMHVDGRADGRCNGEDVGRGKGKRGWD
jgi:hypothetical protein